MQNPAASSRPTLFDTLSTSARRLSSSAWVGMTALFISWFFIESLAAHMGPVRHPVRFFEIAAAIADPAVLFGAAGSHVTSYIFGVFCVFVIFAPLLAQAWAPRFLSLAYCAPLLLMVLCGALLMSRFSGDWVTVSKNAAPLEQEFARLANDLFDRGAGLAARSVKISVGGYLAALASAWLALQGTRLGFRK